MTTGTDILLIDDDRDLVNSVRIVLESRKYAVRVAYNGRDGFAKIQEKIPDLILLDVTMATDTDGIDLAFKLRNDPRYRSISIVMVSGFPGKMAEEGPGKFQHILGESWPVSRFIEKPVDPVSLLGAVEDVLKEAHQV